MEKKLTLLTVKWGRHTLRLISLYHSYSCWGVNLLTITSYTYFPPNGSYETVNWQLISVNYYRQLATFCTVRADVFLFNKQFAWKRKVEPTPDDLPF